MYLICEDSSIDEGERTYFAGPFKCETDLRAFAEALERVAQVYDFRPVATCRDYLRLDGVESDTSPFHVVPGYPRTPERQAELETVAVMLEQMGFERPEGFKLDLPAPLTPQQQLTSDRVNSLWSAHFTQQCERMGLFTPTARSEEGTGEGGVLERQQPGPGRRARMI